MTDILQDLEKKDAFTREDFYNAYSSREETSSEDAKAYALRKCLADQRIVRVAWNKYAVLKEKRIYSHNYSDEAIKIAESLKENYTDLSFQIFEMTQLNSFVNHLIAHNTIFVSVENELIDFVFDTMKEDYPGRVLLKPGVDEYYRYVQDDEIILTRLPSGTPKGLDEAWKSRLEKILVDIGIDKFISKLVPSSELRNIFEGSYERYILDRATMMQYARRKGAVKKMEDFISEYLPQLKE